MKKKKNHTRSLTVGSEGVRSSEVIEEISKKLEAPIKLGMSEINVVFMSYRDFHDSQKHSRPRPPLQTT